ncbi:DNA ligase [Kitasatospora sp. NPDC087861]|uniref:ATP-dependent DNA ligase n=1 Tax=Kitasatospora sp. NPDC087861 TaxID=3364070 RepID=UPI0037F7BE59
MPRTRSPVVLRPPVEVMQPVLVRALPDEDALPGGTQYTIKLDGIRAVAHVLDRHEVRLVSRRGNELGPRFPQLLPALSTLPVGLCLDGEIVAYEAGAGGRPGHLDFTALLRTPAARAAAGTQVLYVVWDALALPGRDIRSRPLRERWEALEMVFAGARPPLQLCMATTSKAEAATWYDTLEPMGIEGLVGKGLDTRYRPTHGAGAWQKVRHTETTDALLLGITGTPKRPLSLLVRLPDGRTALTSPRLTPVQARPIADTLAGRLAPGPAGESAPVWTVTGPPPLVEVAIGSGRHGTVRAIRLRLEE